MVDLFISKTFLEALERRFLPVDTFLLYHCIMRSYFSEFVR